MEHKQYTVLYEAYQGAIQAFGPFDTEDAARIWMIADVKYSEDEARKNNIEVKEDMHTYSCVLENFGEWHVVELEQP